MHRTTHTRLLAVALAALLVSTLIGPAVLSTRAAAQNQQCSPELTVTYDEFRTDQRTIDRANTSEGAVVTKQNTQATVSEGEGFVRAGFENPNSYCVKVTAEISEAVTTPSTLGTVSAANSSAEATWEATHDFEADETYTTVTATVPAETTVLFTPSKLRVESLSWVSETKDTADTFGEQVTELLNLTPKLESRHYTLDGESGEMVTVDLEGPNGETVEDWQATYQLRGESDLTPLSEGSGSPVFYRSLSDEDGESTAIQITFNDAAEVHFTAEPTIRDKAGYDLTSYLSSIREWTSTESLLSISMVGGSQ